MTINFEDIRAGVSAFSAAQAIEVARIAQLASDAMARRGKANGQPSTESYTKRLARRLQLNRMRLSVPAHAQAPAWAANTTYKHSDVVRHSSGALMIVVSSGSGLSHATTEPVLTVGADPAGITDNQLSWWILGEVTQPRVAGSPVITVTDNAGNSSLTTIANFTLNADKFDARSARFPALAVSGDQLSTRSAFFAFDDGTAANNGFGAGFAGKYGLYATHITQTEADLIHIGYMSTATNQLQDRLMLLIDGERLTEAPIIPGGAQGTSRFLSISIPGGRKLRTLEIRTSGMLLLRYVAVDGDCTISAPQDPGTACGIFTDSFGFTEAPGLASAHHDYAVMLGTALGFQHVMSGSVGGSSYGTRAPTGRHSLEQLLAANDFAPYNLDAIINSHGYNAGQAGGIGSAAEAAAMKRVHAKQRAELCKYGPIIFINDHYRNPTGAALHDEINAAIRQAFLELNDPLSVLISPMDGSIQRGNGEFIRTPNSAWITPQVATWALPAGAPGDGAHYTPAGRVLGTSRAVSDVLTAFDIIL